MANLVIGCPGRLSPGPPVDYGGPDSHEGGCKTSESEVGHEKVEITQQKRG